MNDPTEGQDAPYGMAGQHPPQKEKIMSREQLTNNLGTHIIPRQPYKSKPERKGEQK
jgi:hypothetical protein